MSDKLREALEEARKVIANSIGDYGGVLGRIEQALSETSPSAEVGALPVSGDLAAIMDQMQTVSKAIERDEQGEWDYEVWQAWQRIVAALTAKTSPDAVDGWLPIASAPREATLFRIAARPANTERGVL